VTSSDFIALTRAARDPWTFLTEQVHTQDPALGDLPFPDYAYLRDLVTSVEGHRFLLVPKSRQMLVTWTMVALFLWRALFRGPGLFLFLSRNERCAEELIERTRFILDRLPPFLRPRLAANSREELTFASPGSRILSLPASPNGPRMYSPTGVFWDEMAFTPYDEQIWAALKPALDSGGRFTGVSSSGGAHNLFARFVVSAATQQQSVGAAAALFHIHRVHYSLHPERNHEAWKAQAAQGLSAARWQQEQEISFEAQNDLVYEEFQPQLHILPDEWTLRPDWDIFRSIDFGFRHPFVLWLQRTSEGEIIVFDEWAGQDATTEHLLQAVRAIDLAHGIAECDIEWTACDPAGSSAQDSGLSPVDLLRHAGMKLRYRSSRIGPGIERVKCSLSDAGGRVRLRVSPRCRHLIADFGRYRWLPGSDEPVKDGSCDHSMDALRYFFVNLDGAEDERTFTPRVACVRR
jgi:hypothetical protein